MDGMWNPWGCKNEWQSCSMLMATGLQTSQNPVKIQSKSNQNLIIRQQALIDDKKELRSK
jgi:hypothetical protein